MSSKVKMLHKQRTSGHYIDLTLYFGSKKKKKERGREGEKKKIRMRKTGHVK